MLATLIICCSIFSGINGLVSILEKLGVKLPNIVTQLIRIYLYLTKRHRKRERKLHPNVLSIQHYRTRLAIAQSQQTISIQSGDNTYCFTLNQQEAKQLLSYLTQQKAGAESKA